MGNMRIISTGTLSAADQAISAEFRHLANGACGVQITGTFSATFLIEATIDGTNWNPYAFINCVTGATETSITSTGQFRTELVGVSSVRLRMSARTSGSANVTLVVLSN